MKINPINKMAGFGKAAGLGDKRVFPKSSREHAVDRFVPGNVNNKKTVTYNKQAVKSGSSSIIAGFKKESEKMYASLRRTVTALLERQGYSAQRVRNGEPGTIKIDAAARQEAADLIADDGPLGAEAVSNRIVDFALAISGGDKTKLALIKDAIDKGFGEAKNMLGGLPEVSLRTYDLIMEKLDQWEKGE